ncbi:HAD family hydrolase [Dickeya ananatis]|nr:HAD family hydrolase [Dickeya zeae]
MSERPLMNIFFDFDGTLIDSKLRQYELFCKLVPESHFSYEEYWDIKRNRINQEKLLVDFFSYKPEQLHYIKKTWMDEIENPDNIEKDTPFDGVEQLLSQLSKKCDLYLVTARQSTDVVKHQVDKFGWSSFFEKLLVTNQIHTKVDLIRESVNYNSTDIFVGDTGEDIKTGKLLGIKTIAVTYGILNNKVLSEYNPDHLVDSIDGLKDVINTLLI